MPQLNMVELKPREDHFFVDKRESNYGEAHRRRAIAGAPALWHTLGAFAPTPDAMLSTCVPPDSRCLARVF